MREQPLYFENIILLIFPFQSETKKGSGLIMHGIHEVKSHVKRSTIVTSALMEAGSNTNSCKLSLAKPI